MFSFLNPLKKYSDAYLYEVSKILAGELASAIDAGNKRDIWRLKRDLKSIGKEQRRRVQILNVLAARYAN